MPEGADISSAQCRAARGLLGWTQRELADKARIGEKTILRFERGVSDVRPTTPAMLRLTFERSGLRFLRSDGVARRDG